MRGEERATAKRRAMPRVLLVADVSHVCSWENRSGRKSDAGPFPTALPTHLDIRKHDATLDGRQVPWGVVIFPRERGNRKSADLNSPNEHVTQICLPRSAATPHALRGAPARDWRPRAQKTQCVALRATRLLLPEVVLRLWPARHKSLSVLRAARFLGVRVWLCRVFRQNGCAPGRNLCGGGVDPPPNLHEESRGDVRFF